MQEGQATLPVGAVILGHYIVENVLSKGNSGAIYLVTDQRLKNATSNFFTLKEVIDPHKQERRQLIFEGVLLRQLHHYALPRIYGAFNNEEQGRAYVVMEYVAGPNLEMLRQQQPRQRFSLPDIMSLMAPIIDAVSYLHQQQPPIIHRDIKPTNIIVPNAEEARTVLVDFGTMKHLDSRTGVINHARTVRLCSSGYRAPEYYGGSSDTRTDVYGLGATFYTLMTGIMPPDGFSRLTQVGNEEVDPLKPVHEVLPTVPRPVAEAIYRAMSLDVHQRFCSVEQFCEALCEVTYAPPIPVSQPALVLSSMFSTSSPPPVPPVGERAGQILNRLEGDELVSSLDRNSDTLTDAALASLTDTSGATDNYPVLTQRGQTTSEQGALSRDRERFTGVVLVQKTPVLVLLVVMGFGAPSQHHSAHNQGPMILVCA